jgi:hypothetical protein
MVKYKFFVFNTKEEYKSTKNIIRYGNVDNKFNRKQYRCKL